jgi:hypothetical protein
VQFTLPEPFAPMLENTSLNIIPAHILRSAVEGTDAQGNPQFLSTWGTDTAPGKIVGNGPYRLPNMFLGSGWSLSATLTTGDKTTRATNSPTLSRLFGRLLVLRYGFLSVSLGRVRPRERAA